MFHWLLSRLWISALYGSCYCFDHINSRYKKALYILYTLLRDKFPSIHLHPHITIAPKLSLKMTTIVMINIYWQLNQFEDYASRSLNKPKCVVLHVKMSILQTMQPNKPTKKNTDSELFSKRHHSLIFRKDFELWLQWFCPWNNTFFSPHFHFSIP